MREILRVRELHGGSFALALPDGQIVPFRSLTVEEYFNYEQLIQAGRYPNAYIEDEIFKKCVLDPILVRQISKLRAGVVTTVATTIWHHSGPQSLEELNTALDISRSLVSGAIHDIVVTICTAFPAYTPDMLYEMDYHTLMLRLAQAEKKLVQAGMLKEPLNFESKEAPRAEKRRRPPASKLKQQWEAQRTPPPGPEKATVITKNDMLEHHAAYTGHEAHDRIVLENDMVDETAGIYNDYQEQLKKGQTVEIKTVEERVAAAEARAKQNEERWKAFQAEQAKEKEQLELLLRERKEKKKAARKRPRR
jgi:hypothetical protein